MPKLESARQNSPERMRRPAAAARAALIFALLPLLWGGCATGRTQKLTEERFPPNPEPASVVAMAGATSRPHVAIARLDSSTDTYKTSAVREQQLDELRRRAASLGANGLVEVRHLEQRHRGMVADPTVPFLAWMPGSQSRYFMRGKAVRFLEDADGEAGEALLDAAPEAVDSPPQTIEPEARPGY